MAERTSPDIAAAVKVLRAGGLVAFPTETVYGLGADATNSRAVGKIFAAKGRPGNNPLIMHVADVSAARRYAAVWPEEAEKLAEAFWPGPLTLVVEAGGEIAPEVTAGLSTVGLRVPRHPVALELLRGFGGAVAAPSANRSMRVSPTTAEHVRRELGDAVEVILDGGACEVGIESTVLNVSGGKAVLLRPGGVSREEIEGVIGRVEIFSGAAGAREKMASPGMQAVHYSPAAAMYRFERSELGRVIECCRGNRGERTVVLVLGEGDVALKGTGIAVLGMPDEPEGYGRLLYATLHQADQSGVGAIWAEMPPDEPRWAAVRDRIRRASKAG